MEKQPPAIHPLFAPDSLYSRLRAQVHPEIKVRGYFHWLAARAKRRAECAAEDGLSSAELPDRGDTAADQMRTSAEAEPGLSILDVCQATACVLVVGGSGERLLCGMWLGPVGASLLIVREGNGRHALDLRSNWSGQADPLGFLLEPPYTAADAYLRAAQVDPLVFQGQYPLRAFLLEPEVVSRLAGVWKAARASPPEAPQGELAILEWTFAPETVASNPDVARILAAVPELEGTICWRTRTARFTRLALPESCTQFPPRTAAPFVVVVAHDPDQGQAGVID